MAGTVRPRSQLAIRLRGFDPRADPGPVSHPQPDSQRTLASRPVSHAGQSAGAVRDAVRSTGWLVGVVGAIPHAVPCRSPRASTHAHRWAGHHPASATPSRDYRWRSRSRSSTPHKRSTGFRAVLLARLVPTLGPSQALWMTSVLFGLAHWFGHPSGPTGVGMAGFARLMRGKSMLETRGFVWAWIIHGFLDVVIFALLLMSSR